RTIWYARFWEDDLQSYSSGRSTGQSVEAAAHRIAQKWLAEGVPELRKRQPKVSQKRIMATITKYLESAGVIDSERKYEADEILKELYVHITGQQMASSEGFVAYLLRFWDWNGDYVQGRFERNKSIGRKYVDDCQAVIKTHIAPFFKDTALCDVTPLLLESFMKSIPRRDADPEHGYSRRTINIMMKVIKKALKEAVRLGVIPKNPADSIELLADDTRERGILKPDEIERLFQIDEWKDERGKTASILAAVSGMRLGEIVALQGTDIDSERNIIYLRHNYSAKEQRLKSTKSGKERLIYTDSSIIKMLLKLYKKKPYQGTFIFWGLKPDGPIRFETLEKYLEIALGNLFGEEVRKAETHEWQDMAHLLAVKADLQPEEIVALRSDDLNVAKVSINIRHNYRYENRRLVVIKKVTENTLKLDTTALQRLSSLCRHPPYIFIFTGADKDKLHTFTALEQGEAKKISSALGEVVRRERNISFHGFRHFFNSTIRGTVSDDILRLQTGHSDEKMTDLYDHMTDDRGEQLRKAVQAKILPFIPKEAAGE
ncbi:MAG: tyrosine-type recombinase/integrase, partial [Prevotella sp.]|nr:tyrosine-type recombinase/integrase [Prevotella sp.]